MRNGNTDLVGQGESFFAPLREIKYGVLEQAYINLTTGSQDWIKAGERVLKNHRHCLPVESPARVE